MPSNPFSPNGGGLFETTANQAQNTFQTGPNMAEFMPGWGQNPAYQTPAYDAPYRPQYQGPNPYASYQRPGFLGGLNTIFNPLAPDPYWGNPVEHMQAAAQSVGSGPMDAAMWTGQRIVGPALAYGLASKFLSTPARNFSTNFATGMLGSFGLKGAAASKVARGLGFVGGAILPYAIGDMALDAAQSVAFDPYIRTRQLGRTLQDSTQGFSYGAGYGNSISGRGLSSGNAAILGGGLDRQGIMDMTFSAEEYQGITGMASRAGMFNQSSPGAIPQRMKDIASQIKMILAISRDPSIQNAIEELGKLQTGGASLRGGVTSQAGRAYSGIGMLASAGATNVQYLMNTVGAQGQYMYQMNGMTPYLGQMAAASTYAGFSSAFRSGLVNPSLMARMGGLEGATQSSMSGMVAAVRTPYAQMQGFNQYMLGGRNGSVTDTVSSFGAAASQDPLAMAGKMALYGGAIASRMAKDRGSKLAEENAISYLRSIGQRPQGPGGQYSPDQVAAVLKQTMGWTDEQLQAYGVQRASETDAASTNLRIAGIQAQTIENDLSIRSQEGVAGTSVVAGVKSYARGKKGLIERMSRPFAGLAVAAGEAMDSMTGFASDFTQGKRIDTSHINKLVQDQGYGLDLTKVSAGRGQGAKGDLYREIAQAAKGGGPRGELANALLSGKLSGVEAKRALKQFVDLSWNTDIQSMYEHHAGSPEFVEEILSGLKAGSTKLGPKDFVGSEKGMTDYDTLTIAGEASQLRREIGAAGDDMGVVLNDLLPKYKHLSEKLKGKSTSQQTDYIRGISKDYLEFGMGGAIETAANTGLTLEEIARNPSKFTKDPQLQKDIRAAAGNKTELNRIVMRETARRNGGVLALGGRTIRGTLTDDAFAKMSANQASYSEAASRTAEEGKSEVDWKGFTDVSNKLDSASSKLLQAANALLMAASRGSAGGQSGQRGVVPQ